MRRALLTFGPLLLLGYGCSLINAPDEVQLSKSTGGSSSGSGGDTSSTGGMGGEAGSGAGAGGTPVVAPTTGLFVMGALDGSERVLSVIDTDDATELKREPLDVAAVAYDRAPGRYYWYVFTAADYPAAPTKRATLEVRRFDDAKKAWTVVSKTTALPPPRPDTLVVLNDRLAYLSAEVVNNVPVDAVTVLDTSDVNDVTVLHTRTVEPGEFFVGLSGVRDGDPQAPGGVLDLMIATGCNTPGLNITCDLSVLPLVVADEVGAGVDTPMGQFQGTPKFAASLTDSKVYIAKYDPNAPTLPGVVVLSFVPDAPELPEPIVTTSVAQDISGFDVLDCPNVVAFTEGSTQNLIVVNLVTGGSTTKALASDGSGVYTEPFASRALALADGMGMGGGSGAYTVRGFNITRKTAATVDVDEEHPVWTPPTDIEPLTGATRTPETLSCN